MAPDVMEAAKTAIEALGYGPVLLTRLAASRGHDDAVVLRPMPTTDAVRHMDGTRRVGYVLQVIVKDTSEAKAMGDAYDLADALARWGRPDGKGGKAHVFGDVEFSDCEDAAELKKLTEAQLAKVIREARKG